MDSLRYWALEMHVDGFRFDLASTLARELHEVDRLSAFFDIVQQDPVDLAGEADRRAVGRRRGRLPGRQLPAAAGRSGTAATATRSATSGAASRRRWPSSATGSPAAPTCTQADSPASRRHRSTSSPPTTGSRCADLVSYNEKHNEANGEANHDGESHNRSWNHGVEGPTDDPDDRRPARPTAAQPDRHAAAVAGRADAARRRRARSHPARQQQRLLPGQRDLVVRLGRRRPRVPRLVRRLVAVPRNDHPVFRRRRWFQGRRIRGIDDMVWFRHDGVEMTDDDWETGYARSVGVFINGEPSRRPTPTAGASSTTPSSSCSTPATSTSRGRCPSAGGAATGSSSSTPRRPDDTGRVLRCRRQARGDRPLDDRPAVEPPSGRVDRLAAREVTSMAG